MWVARFSLKYQGDIFTERTARHNVNFYAYPATHYTKKNQQMFVVMGILEGEDRDKVNFIKDLKKDKRIAQLDVAGDVLTILINYPAKEIKGADMDTFYDSSIVHLEPILNSKDGREYWTAASFEKERLAHILDSAIKLHEGKLISMNNTKVESFSLVNLRPQISKQQQKVLTLAFQKGYYSYPRKVEIRELAKVLKMSYSTCQEHLRKAEIALLPAMLKKL